MSKVFSSKSASLGDCLSIARTSGPGNEEPRWFACGGAYLTRANLVALRDYLDAELEATADPEPIRAVLP